MAAETTAPQSTITWQCTAFRELSPDDLYAAMQLRQIVFVVEQSCAYLDADGFDRVALQGTERGIAPVFVERVEKRVRGHGRRNSDLTCRRAFARASCDHATAYNRKHADRDAVGPVLS